MRAILYLVRLGGWKFVGAGFLSLIAGLGSGYAIKLINESIHNGIDDIQQFIIQLSVCLITFIVVSIVASTAIIRILQKIIATITKNISKKILHAEFVEIESNQHKLMSVFFHDINTISRLTEKIPNLFVSMTVVIICTGYIFYLSKVLFLMLIGLILLVGLSVVLTNNPLRKIAKINRGIIDTFLNKTNHLIYGIRELKLNKSHRDYFIEREFEGIIENKKKHIIKERVIITTTDKIVESSALISIATMVLLFTYLFDNNDHQSFVEGFTMTLFLAAPLASVASFAKNLKEFDAAINQIKLLGLELDRKAQNVDNVRALVTLDSPIVLSSVDFHYPNSNKHFSLNTIDLSIEPGTITFITGGNGSGKTTLGKIITGLYNPSNGKIIFNDFELNYLNKEQYRNLFATIWNDNHIFEDVNYTDWRHHPWQEILRKLELDDHVSINNGIYSNVKLSSGQLKRLSLLTLLLENKPVCFFDEWAANQDIEFKDYFYNEVLSDLKSKGKTVIAITHDEKYFSKADYIYRLQDGKLKK